MGLRVVSLVPSTTETLLSWGVDVVACTRFCEQPQLAHVGGTKDPDIAAVIALRPDVVVVDREENRRDDADALVAAGVRIHVTHVRSLADVVPMTAELAEAVGIMVPQLSPELDATAQFPQITAFVPIWRRPWMTINGATYGSSVLAHLGVVNVFSDHPDNYPVIDLDEVVARQPGMVLLPSEPYRFSQRHAGELVARLPAAVVVDVDGQDLFWWGIRTPAAIGRLRDVVFATSPDQ